MLFQVSNSIVVIIGNLSVEVLCKNSSFSNKYNSKTLSDSNKLVRSKYVAKIVEKNRFLDKLNSNL